MKDHHRGNTKGTNSSKINGETVPISRAQALQNLIDIHGQHEHQSLLYEKNHLGILDNFARAELGDRLVKCRRLHRKYMQARRQWADASSDAGSRAKELDFSAVLRCRRSRRHI